MTLAFGIGIFLIIEVFINAPLIQFFIIIFIADT